jgi:transcriptional regulator with XRE-family HTH domain
MASRKPKDNPQLNALMLDIGHLDKPRSKRSSEPELELGSRLARLREQMDWSQEQLSEATKAHDTGGVGLSRAVISMYERGRNRPSTRELRILCDTLRAPPSQLLYGTDTPFDGDRWQILDDKGSDALYFARWIYLFSQLDSIVQLSIYDLVIAFLRPTNTQVERLDGLARELLLRLAADLQAESTVDTAAPRPSRSSKS